MKNAHLLISLILCFGSVTLYAQSEATTYLLQQNADTYARYVGQQDSWNISAGNGLSYMGIRFTTDLFPIFKVGPATLFLQCSANLGFNAFGEGYFGVYGAGAAKARVTIGPASLDYYIGGLILDDGNYESGVYSTTFNSFNFQWEEIRNALIYTLENAKLVKLENILSLPLFFESLNIRVNYLEGLDLTNEIFLMELSTDVTLNDFFYLTPRIFHITPDERDFTSINITEEDVPELALTSPSNLGAGIGVIYDPFMTKNTVKGYEMLFYAKTAYQRWRGASFNFGFTGDVIFDKDQGALSVSYHFGFNDYLTFLILPDEGWEGQEKQKALFHQFSFSISF